MTLQPSYVALQTDGISGGNTQAPVTHRLAFSCTVKDSKQTKPRAGVAVCLGCVVGTCMQRNHWLDKNAPCLGAERIDKILRGDKIR